MQVAPGITIGGKYTVERALARGGMGSVWVARHVKLGNPVAVKVLDAHLAAAPALVARFEREARAAANLDTPHVVKVHDYGVEDGAPYLVMELLRGEDLNERLRQRRRLPLAEAARIVSQMGRALRRAHEVGIVHRDLKPANVFLASVEDEEVVKILDFGIAKETWSRVDDSTKTGEIFGSPHYMSPEQARAQKTVDHRADIWATGVIVYRMITGRLPFPGEVLGEVLSSVLVDPFPPIAQTAPDLPAALEGFFARALAKQKEGRFSSISELVDAFAAIAAGRAAPVMLDAPVTATAPTLEPAAPADGGAGAGGTGPRLGEGTGTMVLTPVHGPSAPPAAPFSHAPAAPPSPTEATGPSIANASIAAVQPRRQGSPVIWIALGLAVCAAAVGGWALFGGRGEPGSGSPVVASEPPAGPSNTATVTVEPARPVEPGGSAQPGSAAAPSGTGQNTAPAASSAAAAGSGAVTAQPPAPAKTAQAAATASPAPAKTGPAPRPTGGVTTKKQQPDWGL